MLDEAMRFVHSRVTAEAVSYHGHHSQLSGGDLQLVVMLCCMSMGACLLFAIAWLTRGAPVGISVARRVCCAGGALFDEEAGGGVSAVSAIGLANACVGKDASKML